MSLICHILPYLTHTEHFREEKNIIMFTIGSPNSTPNVPTQSPKAHSHQSLYYPFNFISYTFNSIYNELSWKTVSEFGKCVHFPILVGWRTNRTTTPTTNLFTGKTLADTARSTPNHHIRDVQHVCWRTRWQFQLCLGAPRLPNEHIRSRLARHGSKSAQSPSLPLLFWPKKSGPVWFIGTWSHLMFGH